jgi:hypothetical protein
MGGGLMQLVAYGAQDIYLTGNPQITFFKVVYRRHTNFSMEAIEQTWNGSSTTDGRCTATISRNGDLVHRMYLELAGTPSANADNLSCLIKSVELEIGGQKIDKHSGKWMEIWAELTEKNSNGVVAVNAAAGNGTLFQNTAGMGGMTGAAVAGRWTMPLQFWFCRNPGLALPLIALQYHEVKVILDHIILTTITANTVNKLWCDYIYLDTDERRRFAQVSHEYLIEQVQEQTLATTGTSHNLNFNHPVKELIWASSTGAAGALTSATIVIPATLGTTYQLKLNGHDRFAARDSRYFSRTQVWEHHSGAGGLDSATGASGAALSRHNDSINVYSFALKPEEHQPSGTCNFSRIDNAQLVGSIAFTGANPHIYAVNYNVLRIMSGMGGLAYSN